MSARKGRPDATGRSSGKFGGRIGKLMKPPKGEPFVWLTRELLESDAWQSLGINARRLIDRLLLDHMSHAGTENGRLKATHAQLEQFGISRRHIPTAIADAEHVGLIDVCRGGRHVATTYTLTWLPLPNGTPASNRWKLYCAKASRKGNKSALRRDGNLPSEGMAIQARLPPEGMVILTPRRDGPSISRMGAATNGTAPAAAWPPAGYILTWPELEALCIASGHGVKSFARRIGVDTRRLRRKGPMDFGPDIMSSAAIDQMRAECGPQSGPR